MTAPGAPAPKAPAVEVRDLVVSYGRQGEVVALHGVSLQADYGEVVAVLGPNGAGKTSLVETLEGYRRPSAGHVRVAGFDPVASHAEVVRRIGVVLQRGGVYPMMSAERALHLFASYYETPKAPDELLELVGLESVRRTPYKRLSGGEQQRLALALALVGRPSVAFLDEPTAGVDPLGRRKVRDVVAGLAADGVCVVLTSHELDEVERVADRVVVLDHGLVVADGRPGELAGGVEEIRFVVDGPFDAAELAAVLGAPVVPDGAAGPLGAYRVGTAPSPAAVAALTSWLAARDLTVAELRTGGERLEEVFLRLVSSEDGGDAAAAGGRGGARSARTRRER